MAKCSICGKDYEGYGNNAKPVNNGQCCDECNFRVVIPERMKRTFGMPRERRKKN